MDLRKPVDEIEFKPKTTLDTHFKDAVLEFMKITPDIVTNSEAIFMDKFLMPFVRHSLLTRGNVAYSM